MLICVNLAIEHTHGSFNCMRITVTLPDVHLIIPPKFDIPIPEPSVHILIFFFVLVMAEPMVNSAFSDGSPEKRDT